MTSCEGEPGRGRCSRRDRCSLHTDGRPLLCALTARGDDRLDCQNFAAPWAVSTPSVAGPSLTSKSRRSRLDTDRCEILGEGAAFFYHHHSPDTDGLSAGARK